MTQLAIPLVFSGSHCTYLEFRVLSKMLYLVRKPKWSSDRKRSLGDSIASDGCCLDVTGEVRVCDLNISIKVSALSFSETSTTN